MKCHMLSDSVATSIAVVSPRPACYSWAVLFASIQGAAYQEWTSYCGIDLSVSLYFYSRMLPGPLMMYQFQRSFIKAASKLFFFLFELSRRKRIDFSISRNIQNPKINTV